jgi:hypothetical protein
MVGWRGRPDAPFRAPRSHRHRQLHGRPVKCPCFEDPGDYTPAEIVLWMTERQDQELARLGLPFGGLWGRPLHAIDCQGLFCETDKYCREAAPELASARKRIKARFTPATEPVRLFFPPKWAVNDKLPAHPAARATRPNAPEQAVLF